MYVQFFGLKQPPFSIAPDPRYLFMSERHREALAHLLYGVNGGGGFVLLSGEIGAGKTTVCRCFLEQIPRRCNVAYIFNPKLTAVELLNSICTEFGIAQTQVAERGATVKDFLDPLNEFLLRTHAVGQNNVLIIDEAQMLSAEVLEQLRLLTNLETNERKLLQIILIGQPELRNMLARPELEQLAQRVIARYHLGALTAAETAAYIRHRLTVAGMTIANPFDNKAMQRIHQVSRGVPRRINLLCDRALLGAFSLGKGQVDREIVEKAAHEVFGRSRARAKRARERAKRMAWGSVAVVALMIFVASAVLLFDRARRPGVTALETAHAGTQAGGSSGAGTGTGTATGSGTGGAGAGAGSASLAASSASDPGASAPGTMNVVAGSDVGEHGSKGRPTDARLTLPVQAASAPTFLTAAELQSNAKSPARDERAAWRELAPSWKLTLADGDPCALAQRSRLQCFRDPSSTLAQIRQLDRPGILTLHDATDRPIYALLTGLSSTAATLHFGEVTQNVSLVSLATVWRGDFATFWRSPPAYSGKVVDANSGAIADWVSAQLDTLHAPAVDGSWKARISAFQLSQGLKPSGTAGPTTFMQLNRATGVEEPRLRTDPSAP